MKLPIYIDVSRRHLGGYIEQTAQGWVVNTSGLPWAHAVHATLEDAKRSAQLYRYWL